MSFPTAQLDFRDLDDGEAPAPELSALSAADDVLWCAGDEGTAIERLVRQTDGSYAQHQRFPLADFLELPGGADGEVDVEGLEAHDGWLWVTGSHSLKRRKPDPDDGAKRGRRTLGKLERDVNRYLLARIPIVGAGAEARLVREDGDRVAARLQGGRHGNLLIESLRQHALLSPFLSIPSKDNGLDVEGITVGKHRVLLGLRGPVLRGWAVVLGLALEPAPETPALLRLGTVGKKGREVDTHLLDLRGLGVRELCRDGKDVLVLAGPTMALAGDAYVFRWRRGAKARGDTITGRESLEVVARLPYGGIDGEDVEHPEGVAVVGHDDGRALLVGYDSPKAARRVGPSATCADLVPLE